jgi:hypothetical protein
MTRPQPRVTTLGQQQRLTPHMGGSRAATCIEKVIYSKASTVSPDPCIYGPDLQVWPRTSTCANRTPRMGSGPPYMGSRPPTVGSQGSRIEHSRALIGTQAGVQSRHVSRPNLVGFESYRIHSCPPPRRRPDAATWPTARGVSQRAEPDIKPLGYARLDIYCR